MDRESFFASAPAVEVEAVALPDGRTVRVRQLTVGDRDRFEASASAARSDIRARLLVACCVDEDGKPLFTPDDIPRLSALPAAHVEPAVVAGMRLSALAKQDVDELEKNSEASP